jgi:uncharacterized membrane protein YbaN (DUF454 family)
VKILLVVLGTLSLGIGVVGIVVPGLPTTTFLLIAAACYVRSNDRLYRWLVNHPVLGRYIATYLEHRAMPMRSKVIALVAMWGMISVSAVFFIESTPIRAILAACAVIGTVVILRVRTLRPDAELTPDRPVVP